MYRRKFISSVAALSALSLIPRQMNAAAKTALLNPPQEDLQVIKPPRLKKGDTVALVAPGGYLRKGELKDSVDNLEKLGFKVVYTEKINKRYGYLAGHDEERAADLMEMFTRKDVDAIMCARGGYGSTRILHMLDYNLIKSNPKILIGYSDITALLNAIFEKTGLIGFHGPVGISTFNDFSLYYFNNILYGLQDDLTLWSAKDEKPDLPERKITVIRSGKCKGRLAGGNLSLMAAMVGTPFDINTDGKIIFLEEISEKPYRVDRMLTQMISAGKFSKAAGIALGVFDKCVPDDKDNDESLSVMEVIFDRLYSLGIPVIYGLSFGHITNKFTLPVGINAELDVNNQVVRLLEKAVV
ncbi:MAG: S66 peptidase family protein [Syntrophothermus sp.]